MSVPVSTTESGDFVCKSCAFSIWRPIADLAVSAVGLYDDRRFPGRCLVVFREHVEHLTEVSDTEAHQFLDDARMVAKALLHLLPGTRINYAVLGNTEPHLHMHLIPRVPHEDPVPLRTPWEHPEARSPMDGSDASNWVLLLAQELHQIKARDPSF